MRTEWIKGPELDENGREVWAYKIIRANGFVVAAAPPPSAGDPCLSARVHALNAMRRLWEPSIRPPESVFRHFRQLHDIPETAAVDNPPDSEGEGEVA